MNKLKRETSIFLTAIMFYTRIPCPKWVDHSGDILNKSTRYFPIIGWIVGGAVAIVYWLASMVMPQSISVVLSMIAGIFITGAFHEDGLADVCDGFGGGWTKDDRLRIMKDSRIGTYGTVSLVLILLLKFVLLSETPSDKLVITFIVAHALSRFIPVIVIYVGTYSRDDLTSKVKPIGKRIKPGEFIFALITALIPILFFQNYLFFAVTLLPVFSGLILMRYFRKRIDGYTGDCLGSIQQVSEILIYLSLLGIFSF